MTTNIFPLLGAIFVLFLGFFVLFQDRRSVLNQLFFGFCVVVFCWLFGTFMMFLNRGDEMLAIFWDRFVYLGVVFMPTLMHHFSLVFTPPAGKWQKKVLFYNYLISFLFLLLSRTDYFVAGLFQYQWGAHTRAQIGHHIFILWFYFASALMFVNFYRFYKSAADAAKKAQILYATVAFLSIILIGGTAYLPAYGIAIYPFSYLSGVFFAACLAYAILRYQFLDIRVFIRRSGFYFFTGLVLLGVYGVVLWGIKYFSSWGASPLQLDFNYSVVNNWYFPISALINAIITIVFGWFVLSKNYSSRLARWFFALCISTFIWSGGYFCWQIANSAISALFWSRVLMLGAIFTALFFLHWVAIFLNLERKLKYLLVLFYCNAFFWVAVSFTSYFVSGVEPRMFFKFWPTPGLLYSFYLFLWLVQVVFASTLLFKKYFSCDNQEEKNQVGIILVGLVAAFLGGATNYLLWYNIPIAPWGNILVMLIPISIGYAILRYQFLNIRVFIRKSAFYFSICLSILLIYWLSLAFFRQAGSAPGLAQFNRIDWTRLRFWYFPISGLVNGLASIILGLFLLLKDWRSKLHRQFFYFCLSVAFFSFSYFIWCLSNTDEAALFWARVLMLGVIFIAPLYLHFIVLFIDKREKFFYLLVFFYLISALGAIVDCTPYFVVSVGPKLFFDHWLTLGVWSMPFIAFWFLQIIIALILLFKRYLTTKGVEKKQTLIVFIGFVIGFLGGSTNYLLDYNILIPPYGNILATVFVVLTAYAILRYRFLDIHFSVRKWLFYLFLGLVIAGVYMVSGGVLTVLDIANPGVQYGLAGLLAVLVSVFIFPRLERFLIVNKLFFKNNYDQSDAAQELSRIINSNLDFDHLAEESFKIFKKIFGVEKLAFLLYGTNGHTGKIMNLKFVNFVFNVREQVNHHRQGIFKFFAQHRRIVLLQELPYQIVQTPLGDPFHQQLIRAMEFLRGLGAEAALPIYYQGELTAILALGPKPDKEIYSSQDIQLLETFANQLAVALENIRSYAKIKNYSADLQREVTAATAELQSLNDRQSRFLADIAHELQSPVAILQGNLQLIEEEGCQTSLIENSLSSSERLSRLINNLLLLAKADFGQLEIDRANFDLAALLREVEEETRALADDKKISYAWSLPASRPVYADREKLKSVFLNVISNALKHTPRKGKITVVAEIRGEKTRIVFFNSGSKVPAEDLPHLFERFYHRSNDITKGKAGTGLGLSIAKSIVDGHGGSLIVKNVEGGVEFEAEL
ncbi:MAG: histidine kinase N-terminal 7TM domain-containing protein [Patescibacteria group bacterium]|jgi:signal transduction histidine kinase